MPLLTNRRAQLTIFGQGRTSSKALMRSTAANMPLLKFSRAHAHRPQYLATVDSNSTSALTLYYLTTPPNHRHHYICRCHILNASRALLYREQPP